MSCIMWGVVFGVECSTLRSCGSGTLSGVFVGKVLFGFEEKENAEKMLEEKMDRWEYLEELAAKIAGQQS